jgi:hypothetical protein
MSSRFHHSPATPADIPTLAQLFYTSFLTYDVWAASMRDVSEEGQLSFLTQILARRFDDPGALVTKAVEVETKLVRERIPFTLSLPLSLSRTRRLINLGAEQENSSLVNDHSSNGRR